MSTNLNGFEDGDMDMVYVYQKSTQQIIGYFFVGLYDLDNEDSDYRAATKQECIDKQTTDAEATQLITLRKNTIAQIQADYEKARTVLFANVFNNKLFVWKAKVTSDDPFFSHLMSGINVATIVNGDYVLQWYINGEKALALKHQAIEDIATAIVLSPEEVIAQQSSGQDTLIDYNRSSAEVSQKILFNFIKRNGALKRYYLGDDNTGLNTGVVANADLTTLQNLKWKYSDLTGSDQDNGIINFMSDAIYYTEIPLSTYGRDDTEVEALGYTQDTMVISVPHLISKFCTKIKNGEIEVMLANKVDTSDNTSN